MIPELAEALAKRGRTWGDQNAAQIAEMREETPPRYPRDLPGDGHWVRARRYAEDPLGIEVVDKNGRKYRYHL